MRKVYGLRRDALVTALRASLPELAFEVPAGGLAVWARSTHPALADVDAWAERAARSGVLVHTARRFTFDGRAQPYFRLGFAPLDPARLREAVRLLAAARGA
jgi:DNA-binding transcriptional MocR family regulator